MISTQGGGLQVFSNISQAIHSKAELLTAWRAAAALFTSDTLVGGGWGLHTELLSLAETEL